MMLSPLLLLSLAGLPPLSGFFPKWIILETISPQSPLLAIILILGSTLNLVYYLNLRFTIFSLPSTPQSSLHYSSAPLLLLFLLAIAALPIII
jgi:NADH:ubiquinone oxidoreductase subunit 2 (subunit N)